MARMLSGLILTVVTVATLSVSIVTAAAAQTEPVCRTVGQCLKIAADARARVQGIASDDTGWFLWGMFAFVVLPQLVGLAVMGLTTWWANGGGLPRLIVTWRPAGPQRGMTLVEVIVALGIISIGLVALMAVIPYAATNVQTGNTVSTATFLANAKIDQAKNAATPSNGNATVTPPILPNPGYAGTYDITVTPPPCTGIASDTLTPIAGTDTPMPDYTRVTTVSDVAGTGACPIKLVTVTTSYRGAQRATVWIQISPR